MTREKAVNEYVIPALKNTWNEKVCAEVINALEQQLCEDSISRQAVLMELDKYLCGVPFDEKGIDEVIKELPPVTPQPKTGWWIIIDDCEQFIAKCSECGEVVDSRDISKYPYCHCGAKMQGRK